MPKFNDIYKYMSATDLLRHYAYLARAMIHHAIETEEPPRKDDRGKHKLTAAQALKIYKSRLPHVELARRYDIHYVTVSDIKHGRSWNKVTGHPKYKKGA